MRRLLALGALALACACSGTEPVAPATDAGPACSIPCGPVCCQAGETCRSSGNCSRPCVPTCEYRQCGSDGCGGQCGTCNGWDTCDEVFGVCNACVPQCAGRQCGADQ